jgi:hypothetical protein
MHAWKAPNSKALRLLLELRGQPPLWHCNNFAKLFNVSGQHSKQAWNLPHGKLEAPQLEKQHVFGRTKANPSYETTDPTTSMNCLCFLSYSEQTNGQQASFLHFQAAAAKCKLQTTSQERSRYQHHSRTPCGGCYNWYGPVQQKLKELTQVQC